MRWMGGATIAMTAAAVITACSTPSPEPGNTSSSSPVSRPTGLTPAPTGLPELHDDGSTGSPPPARTLRLDDATRTQAVSVGTRVMTLFARPGITDIQWVQDLSPHLTTRAAQTYKYVDPRNVPVTQVTGRATLTPASTDLVARVSVPTDVGVYLVILSRSQESPAWLADRIMPPEGSGDS